MEPGLELGLAAGWGFSEVSVVFVVLAAVPLVLPALLVGGLGFWTAEGWALGTGSEGNSVAGPKTPTVLPEAAPCLELSAGLISVAWAS